MAHNIRLLDNYKNTQDRLENASLAEFEEYNEKFYQDDWLRYSEASTYRINAIKKWISIRDDLTYVDDPKVFESIKGWKYLDISESHKKYGTNFIYIHLEKKLWRIKDTASEFYGDHGDPLE